MIRSSFLIVWGNRGQIPPLLPQPKTKNHQTRTPMALDIPPHLRSVLELVDRAYPEGVPADEYLAVLFVFSEYLCEGNLGILAEHINKEVLSGLNDGLKARVEKPDTSAVMRKLEPVGFQEWAAEEES